MLLGVDDVVVRWWRDERVMDGSYCDPRTPGENHPRTPCVSRSRHWSYHRRLVADAAYVICRSCADIRLGAYALRWVDQSLITPPCADRSGAALTIIAGSALGWALDPADRGATTFGHTGLPWLGLRADFLTPELGQGCRVGPGGLWTLRIRIWVSVLRNMRLPGTWRLGWRDKAIRAKRIEHT